MTDDQVIELAGKLRTRWRSTDLTDADHLEWRAELALLDYDAAHTALTQLYRKRPHQRPTLEQFAEAVHNVIAPNRLSPQQIETNLNGIRAIREALQRAKTGSNT